MRATVHDLARVLDSMTADRSCWTCESASIVTGGIARCRRWECEIPREALEDGCEQHREDEVPF